MGDDDQFDDGATAKSTGSHFTEYSMSSSVVPRSDQLRQLDSQFEKLFLSEYGDEEAIGALDGDEEFDDENTKMDESQQELIKAALEEYAEAKQERAGIEYVGNKEAISFVRARYLSKKATANGGDSEASEESSDSDSEYEEVEVVDPGRKGDKERLDCESVLSTYSNTTYHPKVSVGISCIRNLIVSLSCNLFRCFVIPIAMETSFWAVKRFAQITFDLTLEQGCLWLLLGQQATSHSISLQIISPS